MKELAMRRLAYAFAATLAACGGGTDSASIQTGSPIAAPPPPAPAPPPGPAPSPSPAPVPAPPPVPPPASATPTIVEFPAAAPGVIPALVGGSITVAGDGNIWFSAGFASNQIGRMTAAGVVSYPVTSGPGLGAFNTGPLATGPDGNVWFSDPVGGTMLSGAIGTIDVATGVASEYATPLLATTTQVRRSTSQDQSCNAGTCTPVAAGTCVPSMTITCLTSTTGPTPVLACTPFAGSASNAYTTTTCNTAVSAPMPVATCTYTPPVAGNSFVLTTCTGITPGSQAYAVTSGPDGNVWFTEYVAARVGKFDVTTKTAIEYGPLTAPARAITAGPDGNVWFAETVDPTAVPIIGRITPAGVITEYSNGLVAGASIGGMTAGADGSVWFLTSGGGGTGIGKIDPASGTITIYGNGLFGDVPLLGGITAGPDGNIWFTDYYEGLIGRIAPNGTIAEFGVVTPGAQINAITAGPAGSKTLWFSKPTEQSIGRATLP